VAAAVCEELAVVEGVRELDTVTLGVSVEVAATDGVTEDNELMDGEPLAEFELGAASEGETLPLTVRVGVPLQMQTPLAVEPQETRQQSAGQGVFVGDELNDGRFGGKDAELLTEAEGVDETQTQTMFG
jgi:hypothetical protein